MCAFEARCGIDRISERYASVVLSDDLVLWKLAAATGRVAGGGTWTCWCLHSDRQNYTVDNVGLDETWLLDLMKKSVPIPSPVLAQIATMEWFT